MVPSRQSQNYSHQGASEGVQLHDDIAGSDNPTDDAECGMRVRARLEDLGDGWVSLLVFERA